MEEPKLRQIPIVEGLSIRIIVRNDVSSIIKWDAIIMAFKTWTLMWRSWRSSEVTDTGGLKKTDIRQQ